MVGPQAAAKSVCHPVSQPSGCSLRDAAAPDTAERATRRDLDEAWQLQAQFDAQRAAVRAELARVHELSWWDQAQVRDVARAYETAVTLRDEDQTARDAESRIRQELRDRYDVEEAGSCASW